MRKPKERTKFLHKPEDIVFDDYAMAQDELEKDRRKLKKWTYLLIVSAYISLGGVVTVICEPVGMIWLYPLFVLPNMVMNISDASIFGQLVAILLFLLPSLVLYAFCGCLGDVLRICQNIAMFGWFITPFVFLDIFIFLITLSVAVLIVSMVPIIPVGICYLNCRTEVRAAEDYLGYFKNVNE